ncbi:MAG: cytochrome c oxidase assembly protein [Woeseiaceae bacterium]
MSKEKPGPISTGALTARLLMFAAGMFVFGVFVLPPVYDVFCEVTGLGGKTNDRAAENVVATTDESRELNLEFVTTVNQYAPWEFQPAIEKMSIHPGGLYEATFIAKNLTDQHKTAQAVPSVSPAQAASYFKKLDCFCFTAQEFEPGEEKEMPVRFVVDSDLPDFIDTITLSYTFFDAAGASGDAATSENMQHGADAAHSAR